MPTYGMAVRHGQQMMVNLETGEPMPDELSAVERSELIYLISHINMNTVEAERIVEAVMSKYALFKRAGS